MAQSGNHDNSDDDLSIPDVLLRNQISCSIGGVNTSDDSNQSVLEMNDEQLEELTSYQQNQNSIAWII